MVNKGTSSSSPKGLPKITGGNGCEFEHYLFKITAEIEIRKHKLMFCVLLRGGVVSALYRIRSFTAMKCVYLSVAWFQLSLISSHCFESFLWPIVCRRKFHGKVIKYETFL